MVYDVQPKRGPKLLKFLRQHLLWVQNSVFEGEISNADFQIIKDGIKERINKQKDSVIIYTFDSRKYSDRKVIGLEKNLTDPFI